MQAPKLGTYKITLGPDSGKFLYIFKVDEIEEDESGNLTAYDVRVFSDDLGLMQFIDLDFEPAALKLGLTRTGGISRAVTEKISRIIESSE